MYISSYVKYNFNPYGRTEKIQPVSKDVRIKKENYEDVLERENRRYTEKFSMNEHKICDGIRFLSPTEVYLNYINDNKELICALSITTHPVYDIDDSGIGKNVDLVI